MVREQAIKILMGYSHTPQERAALEVLIPELAESEDEKIRKGMIDEIKAILRGEDLGFPPQDVLESRLAYLEKQKEIPLMGGDTDTYFDDLRITTKPLTSREWFNEGIKYTQKLQKEQKPAEWEDYKDKVNIPYCSSEPEWSEENYDKISKQVYKAIRRALASLAVYAEDEALLDSKEETLSYYSQQCAEKILKSLRPSWKPGEEQMAMLLSVINDPNNAGAESCQIALRKLYKKLKELKEGEK